MRNFNTDERLLIIFKRKESGLTVGQLAKELMMSKSNMSRIENGKIMVSEDNEELLEKRFSINFHNDNQDMKLIDRQFRKLIKMLLYYKLFDEFSYNQLDQLCADASKSISYPVLMLLKFCICSAKNIDRKFIDKYFKIFDSLITMFSKDKQTIYAICKVNYLYHNKEYKKALQLCEYIESTYNYEDYLEAYLLHLKAITNICLGNKNAALTTLDSAIFFSNKTNNWIRLIALNITKANFVRLNGQVHEAILLDSNTLQYGEQMQVHIYDYILYRNLAWSHYLLKNYDKAVEYYLLAEKYDSDDDLYFMSALCSFKLGYRSRSRKYLVKARTAKKTDISFEYLIDWLELMLNKKYSVKAEQKLLYCLKKHETTMHVDSRNNIYKFLIEHYKYHQDSKNADYYRKKLQNG